jgi:hypothetical protein
MSRLAATLLLAVALVAAGLAVDRLVEPVEAVGTPAAEVASGSWMCPHGGGAGWTTTVSVANPGERPARIRLSTFDEGSATRGDVVTVEPGTEVFLDAPSATREASSMVEFFDGWVAAGWTSVANGEELGLSSEPCVATSSPTSLLPDNTTLEGESAYVVVMNPFASDAVFSLQATTPDRRIRPEAWADVVLPAGRSQAFHLNPQALGEEVVAIEVTVSIGRVAASALGVSAAGGVRSSIGVPGLATSTALLPGGGDAGTTSLVVLNAGDRGATIGATAVGTTGDPPLELPHEVLPAESAATFLYTIADPGVLSVSIEDDAGGVALVRRSGAPSGDRGSVAATALPGPAWVLPSVRLGSNALGMTVYLANPGDTDVTVVLTPLGLDAAGSPSEVVVPAGGMLAVPGLSGGTGSSILATSAEGDFVPVVGSTGGVVPSFALAMGVPVPERWLPGTP